MPIVEVEGQQFEFPDGTSDEVIGDAIRSHFAQEGSVLASPSSEDVSTVSLAEQDGVPDFATSTGGLNIGAEEALGTVLSGIVAEPVAGLAGLVSLPFAGSEQASENIEGIREAVTFQPRTEASRKGLQTIGDIVEAGIDLTNIPISGLAGIAELISGQGAEQAGKTISDIKQKGVSQTAGDRAFEVTDDPLLATLAKTSPAIIGSLVPVSNIARKTSASRRAIKEKIANKIESGATDKTLADYMIDGAGKLKTDKLAQETIKQGFDQGVIAAVKGSSNIDKAKMASMVEIMRKGKENALFAMKNRPSDVAGSSLLERVNYIKGINRKAGKQVDEVAKGLKGQNIESSQPISNFLENLDEMGIRLDKRFRPNFRGSDIEDLAGPQSAIANITKRLSRGKRGVAPDAHELHRMKRFIDEQVTYGKSGEGLKGKTERVLKQLRSDLDSALDEKFPAYNEANTTYSDTVSALDSLQDVAGKKMDLFGPNADKATGTLLRRMMSNAQSRVSLVDAVDDLESISKKYGANFGDDISSQMLFVDELDRKFGPVARTSLAGEAAKGFKQGAEAATGQRSAVGAVIEAGAAKAEKLRGINEENAFKTISELLKRE